MSKNLLSDLEFSFDQYEIDHSIGEGAYGKVYLIKHKENENIKYAMKETKNNAETPEEKNI